MRGTAAFVVILTLVFPVSAQEWDETSEETQKLSSPYDEGVCFGSNVAISGPTAVIGVSCSDEVATNSGSIYVYQYDFEDAEWQEAQEIIAPDAEENGFFGAGVVIFEDVIAVGARNALSDASAVHVFRYDRDESEWVEEQAISEPDEVGGFGDNKERLAVSGGVLAVGAPYTDVDDTYRAGVAYVFRYDEDDEEWLEEQVVSASDFEDGYYFGESVAVLGDVLLVGSAGAESSDGAVYVFAYDADKSEWAEEQKLTSPDARSLGSSVDLSSDLAIVGDGTGPFGAAYVYRYDEDESEWVEEDVLTASDAADDIRTFGHSVAISGNLVLVGAGDQYFGPTDDSASGAAYLYRYDEDDDEWLEQEKLLNSDAVFDDQFGYGVDLSGTVSIVGAIGGDPEAAYVFGTPDPVFIRGDCNGNGEISITDPLFFLTYQFRDGPEPGCWDAADANDDGELGALVDSLYLLNYLFSDGDIPPEPNSTWCDRDPTEDDIECETVADICS